MKTISGSEVATTSWVGLLQLKCVPWLTELVFDCLRCPPTPLTFLMPWLSIRAISLLHPKMKRCFCLIGSPRATLNFLMLRLHGSDPTLECLTPQSLSWLEEMNELTPCSWISSSTWHQTHLRLEQKCSNFRSTPLAWVEGTPLPNYNEYDRATTIAVDESNLLLVGGRHLSDVSAEILLFDQTSADWVVLDSEMSLPRYSFAGMAVPAEYCL